MRPLTLLPLFGLAAIALALPSVASAQSGWSDSVGSGYGQPYNGNGYGNGYGDQYNQHHAQHDNIEDQHEDGHDNLNYEQDRKSVV